MNTILIIIAVLVTIYSVFAYCYNFVISIYNVFAYAVNIIYGHIESLWMFFLGLSIETIIFFFLPMISMTNEGG